MDSRTFYDSPEWRRLSDVVIASADGRCFVARLFGGACSEILHAHHIESIVDRPDLALVEDNCAAVCSRHHPTWEAFRRLLAARRTLPPCRHTHPYPEGREACERRRMREAGIPIAA